MPGPWSNPSNDLIILSALNSGYSGIFAYSPQPGAGTLVFSVSAVAGTDPWGNSYPAGVSLSTPGSVLQGDDYILNTQGLFYYNGSPGPGNLIMSLSALAGTDGFGNTYPQGLAVSAVPTGTGSLDGSNLVSGSVGSDAIGQGAIVAGMIAAGAIDGMTLNNVTINGQLVSGANVEVSAGAGGIFVYGSPPTVTRTFTAAGTGTFTVPAGVTSLTLQTWAGGGGGSDENTDHSGGAGAGGGAYSTATLAVTPGQTIYYKVGAGGAAGVGGSGGNGQQSWVNTSNTPTGAPCSVNGGKGGTAGTSGGSGGAGGTVAAGTGHSGGAGAAGKAVTSTTSFTGATTGTYTVPPGVFAVTAKTWAAGGGGVGGGLAGGANSGGYAGGGGAYAETDGYAVSPGDSLAYQSGNGGSGGSPNHLGTNGTASWVKNAGGSYIAYADFGHAATLSGGAASGGNFANCTGTITHSGGDGGTASGSGGSGGGGSGGASGRGGNGQNVSGSGGGAGGSAGSGGGATGGNGGSANNNGSQGGYPGGGGGGGGGGSSAGSGGAGRNGQVQVTVSLPEAGGGGASGGTSSAGGAGSARNGGTAVSGGGPGGGTYSAGTWTAAPSAAPGGGGGGYDTGGPAAAGAAGQVVITYAAGTPSLLGSWVAAATTDPQAGISIPDGIVASSIVNLQPGSSPVVPETWHALTLQAGWSAHGTGFGNPKYRLSADGFFLELAGQITGTTGTAGAATFATVPSGYYDTVSRAAVYAQYGTNNAPGTGQTRINLDTSGNLSFPGYGSTGVTITAILDGVRIPINTA